VAYEQNDKKMDSVYSKRIKAGKRRTYFFDVRATRGNDYFLTITESRKRFDSDGYDRHKIFLYKEDFNKFVKGLNEAVDYVKTELMPDFDFDAFNHDEVSEEGEYVPTESATPVSIPVVEEEAPMSVAAETEPEVILPSPSSNGNGVSLEDVDKW
jgi:Protein of unknown function (DUF3276)